MKKLISLLLSVILVCSCMPVACAVDAQPAVSIQSTSAVPGGQISVQVVINNNPGLVTMLLRVGYDSSVLTLQSVTDGGLFGEGNAYFGNDTTANPYVLMWEDGLATENHTSDGTLATLTFLVAENAQPGETEISVTVDSDSTLNVGLDHVQLNTQNGSVIIMASTPNQNAMIYVEPMMTIDSSLHCAVAIRIRNNPGLIALRLLVSFDTSVMTLTGVEDGGLFGDGNAYFGNDYADNPYVLMWEDALSQSNHTSDGSLAILTFEVSENAAEEQTEIRLSLDEESTFDLYLNTPEILLQNGRIISSPEPQGTPTITIGNVIGRAGETVQVPITIQNNPGLIATQIGISYDSDTLTLIDVEDDGLFGDGNAYFGNDVSEMPYTLLWEDALSEINHTRNGTLALLTFRIADDAYGKEAVIELQYNLGSSINVDLEEVPFELQNGKVSVVHKPPMENGLRIFSYDGSFEQQIDWWKKYSSATMTLGFLIYGCDDAVRYVWSTNSWRVDIDQQGHITNSGPFARSAKIRLRAYDRDGNIVAESSVTVRFYKFNWQYRRLQSQEIVSDNVFRSTVEPTATEPETLVSFVTAFFTKVFWWFVR